MNFAYGNEKRMIMKNNLRIFECVFSSFVIVGAYVLLEQFHFTYII